jgi:transcriptional regulator of acetoin/glycerol metabolism
VRELQNLMERLYATCPDGVIDVRHLAGTALANAAAAPSAGAIPAWDEVEKTLLRQALEAAGGNKSEAARLLRIDRKRLLRKVRKHGLDTPQTPTP